MGGAAPFGGGATFGFRVWDWRHTLGSLPFYQSTRRFVKKVVLRKVDDKWTLKSTEGVMETSAG